MWIELKKDIPKVCKSVLICTDKGNVSSGHLSKRYENLWTIDNQELSNEIVIAWQPLPEALKYSEGSKDHCASNRTTHREDFSKDEIEIGEIAFVQCQDRIKNVVEQYLDKEEIHFSVYEACKHSFEKFMEENQEELIGCMAEKLKENIDSLQVDIKVNGKKRKEFK